MMININICECMYVSMDMYIMIYKWKCACLGWQIKVNLYEFHELRDEMPKKKKRFLLPRSVRELLLVAKIIIFYCAYGYLVIYGENCVKRFISALKFTVISCKFLHTYISIYINIYVYNYFLLLHLLEHKYLATYEYYLKFSFAYSQLNECEFRWAIVGVCTYMHINIY